MINYTMGSCGNCCVTCNEICIERYSTKELVKELKKRSVAIYEIKKGDICEIAHEHNPIRFGTSYVFNAIPRYNGPVTILVGGDNGDEVS